MKQKIFKILIFLFLFLFVFYLGVVISYNLYYFFHKKEFTRLQEEWREVLTRPYMEDTFGGKTPQETFDMFLDALKKGDIELASKCFALDRKKKEKKELEDFVRDGYLDELINDLSQAKIDETASYPGTAIFNLPHPQGGFKVYVVVTENLNGIWKIEDF